MATPTQPTLSLKQLAAALADQHELSKKQTEAVLNDMVGLVAKHLKKGYRIRIPASASSRSASVRHAWAAIRPPAKPSRLRRARRSPSAPRRT